MELNGVINVYKEKGYTSHDVVNILKRELKSKTGHTGTLDPDAEGVLPICLGKSTKLADYITAQIKRYRAEIYFGITTDTLDISGNILTDKRPVEVEKNDFLKVLDNFTGEISQIPPMYSAIKINGEKLYSLARKGIEVERKPRNITIHKIDLIEFEPNKAVIDVICSKGTYIRSLCADIGEYLGCGGTMGNLLRIQNGRFSAENALKIDEIKEINAKGEIGKIVIPPQEFLTEYVEIHAKEEANRYLKNGNTINKSLVDAELLETKAKYRLYDSKGEFIGLYVFTEKGFLKPEIILTDLSRM
ncbi:tRNA pseudouridine(55) synthase TruB [Tyzzerella sp. OttesenSCG-928-J15]|nr:tRNA pseudouridine(55) synthase TruB [Tyzzerella sp. OttesenSCG-928-J15]